MSDRSIQITHCTEQDFLDAFRADLTTSTHRVIILSPFLSHNRAANYYPVFQSLNIRRVLIDVYAKPKNEQPEPLRERFSEIERNLTRVGARLHVRSGMHEKIGVVDGKILWHGSLNILSHNDTLESMLRFESSDLVQDILADLKIEPSSDINQSSLTQDKNNPACTRSEEPLLCPQCSNPMLLYENAGMWICSDSPRCQGTLPFNSAVYEARDFQSSRNTQRIELLCPICGSLMEVSRGVFLKLVCSSDNCSFELDPRISAGILRIMRRSKER